jgi:hypothetical protein
MAELNRSDVVTDYCKLCGSRAEEGVLLNDSGVVHGSCLAELMQKLDYTKKSARELQGAINLQKSELKRRSGIGYTISSIFFKPHIDNADILRKIAQLQEQLTQESKKSKEISAALSSVYDLFLSYPPDWEERREAVGVRDGFCCSACTQSRRLHLHHKIPLSRGGTNKVSNLVFLCETCHSKQHGGRDFSGSREYNETAYSKRVSSIRKAISKGRKIRFGYKKPQDKGHKERTVKPIKFIEISHRTGGGSTLCLVGYCELRNAERKFALKRMRGLKVL